MEDQVKPLSERSLPELEDARHHLEKIEAQVARDATQLPGPGWGAVIDILQRDREELEAELRRRENG